MPTIGNLAVRISGNPAGLMSAFQTAQQGARQFGQTMGQALALPAKGLLGPIGIGLSAIEGFKSPIESTFGKVKELVTGIPFLGKAFAEVPTSAAGFVEFVERGMDRIAELGRLADRLGISVQNMGALMKWAGPYSESFAHGLGHLEVEMGKALGGDMEALGKFERLGISARQLADMNADQVIGRIADKTKELRTAAERAALAQDTLGRSGRDMVGKLAQGSEGIEAARKKLGGGVFSQEDVANVRQYQEAIASIKQSISNVGTMFAAELAKPLGAIAEIVAKWLSGTGDLREGIHNLVESATDGFLTVLDSVIAITKALSYQEAQLQRLSAGFAAIGKQFSFSNQGMQNAAGAPTSGLAKLLEDNPRLMAGVREFMKGQPLLGGATESLFEGGKGADNTAMGEAAKKAEELRDGVQKARDKFRKDFETSAGSGAEPFQKAIDVLDKELTKNIATLGLSSTEAKIWEMSQHGASDAALAHVRALSDQAEALQKWHGMSTAGLGMVEGYAAKLNKLNQLLQEGKIDQEAFFQQFDRLTKGFDALEDNKAAELFASTKTPMEQFQTQMEDLNRLVENGKISWETYERATMKAFEALEKTNSAGDVKLPAAVTMGSKEAYSALAHAEAAMMGGRQNPQQRVESLLERIHQTDMEQTKVMRDVVRAVEQSMNNIQCASF